MIAEALASAPRSLTSQLPSRSIRVLIADGESWIRTGVASVLAQAPDLEVVGLAADVGEAMRLISEVRPDVVILDSRLPHSDDGEPLSLIQADPEVRTLILAGSHSDASVIAALQAGARGYVLKSSSAESLAASIRTVMADAYVMSAIVADRMVAVLTGTQRNRDQYDGLTPREVEILTLVAAGIPYKQVAVRLKISHRTVRNYVCRIYEKLAIDGRAQVALYAVRKGLVDL